MTDSAILKLREEYETSEMKMAQFAEYRGLEYEKTRYALRKALKLRRQASGNISFTSIKTDHHLYSGEHTSGNNIIITTSNGTVIQIPS